MYFNLNPHTPTHLPVSTFIILTLSIFSSFQHFSISPLNQSQQSNQPRQQAPIRNFILDSSPNTDLRRSSARSRRWARLLNNSCSGNSSSRSTRQLRNTARGRRARKRARTTAPSSLLPAARARRGASRQRRDSSDCHCRIAVDDALAGARACGRRSGGGRAWEVQSLVLHLTSSIRARREADVCRWDGEAAAAVQRDGRDGQALLLDARWRRRARRLVVLGDCVATGADGGGWVGGGAGGRPGEGAAGEHHQECSEC